MKQALQKLSHGGLFREYAPVGCFLLFSGGLLLVQITKIADRAGFAADNIRFIVLSVAVFILVVMWAFFSLYKKSVSYIRWYQEMLDALPMPIAVTDEDARWQHINKAMTKTMDIKERRDIENLNSRHLINSDGSIKNKIWLHNGEQYQVAGKRLENAGYLIYLNGENGISESVKLQTEMIVKLNRCIRHLSVETGCFRDCTNNISRGILWQSGLIAELIELIYELALNGVRDQHALVARMDAIKADMQRNSEENQADLDRMRRLIRNLNDVREISPERAR